MEIRIKEIGDIRVVNIVGQLDTSTSPEAEAEIGKLLDDAQKKIIINLEELSYLSSSGLRVFLGTAKKLMATGGTVKLCCPNDVVNEILEISGFNTILDVRNTEEEAISEM